LIITGDITGKVYERKMARLEESLSAPSQSEELSVPGTLKSVVHSAVNTPKIC